MRLAALPFSRSLAVQSRCFRGPGLVLPPSLFARRLTHNLAQNEPVEEQTLPSYHRKRYYPVRTGQTFNDRYRTIGKLGYGAYSTVWLAWDERFLLFQPLTYHHPCLLTFLT